LVDTTRILRDGAVLSLLGSIYLLLLLRFHPRLFLQHFPKEIRAVVPPKSDRERRMSILFGLLIGVSCAAAFFWRTASMGSDSFGEIFAYTYGVLFVFNVVDLVILDWLIVCWIEPSWVILPGTEHIVTPKQYLAHFKGFLVGTVGLAAVSLAAAGLRTIR
jgi:hypothetical protein